MAHAALRVPERDELRLEFERILQEVVLSVHLAALSKGPPASPLEVADKLLQLVERVCSPVLAR